MSFLCIVRTFWNMWLYRLTLFVTWWGLVLIPFDFDFLTCHPVTCHSHLPLSPLPRTRGTWVSGRRQWPGSASIGCTACMWGQVEGQHGKLGVWLLCPPKHSLPLLLPPASSPLHFFLSSITAPGGPPEGITFFPCPAGFILIVWGLVPRLCTVTMHSHEPELKDCLNLHLICFYPF